MKTTQANTDHLGVRRHYTSIDRKLTFSTDANAAEWQYQPRRGPLLQILKQPDQQKTVSVTANILKW